MLVLTRLLEYGALLLASAAILGFLLTTGVPTKLDRWFREHPAWLTRLLAVAVSVFILYFGTFAVFRHDNLGTTTLDTGDVEQTIWNTAHGAPFRMTTQPEFAQPVLPTGSDLPPTRLAYHVEPIIIPLAILYAALPRTETILLLQVIAVGLGAVLVAKIAQHLLGSPFAALAFAVIYLLADPIQNAVTYEVHPVVFGLPAFLLAFWLFLQRRYTWAVVASLGLLFAREDAAATALLFGVFLLCTRGARRHGVVLTLLSAAWIVAAFAVINHLNPHGYSYFDRSALPQPFSILYVLSDPYRWHYLLWLLVPLAFLPLAGLRVAFISTVSIGSMLVVGKDHELLGFLHYHAVGYGPLIVSAVVGAGWVTKRFRRWVAPATPVVAALLCSLGMTTINGAFLPFRVPDWQQLRAIRAAVRLIPADASVAASWNLGPWVSRRRDLFLLNSPQAAGADALFVRACPTASCDNFSKEAYDALLQRLADAPLRHLVFDRDGIRAYLRTPLP